MSGFLSIHNILPENVRDFESLLAIDLLIAADGYTVIIHSLPKISIHTSGFKFSLSLLSLR